MLKVVFKIIFNDRRIIEIGLQSLKIKITPSRPAYKLYFPSLNAIQHFLLMFSAIQKQNTFNIHGLIHSDRPKSGIILIKKNRPNHRGSHKIYRPIRRPTGVARRSRKQASRSRGVKEIIRSLFHSTNFMLDYSAFRYHEVYPILVF